MIINGKDYTIGPCANLCGADLRRADLCCANLCGADLRRADLCGANLYGANLYGANLCGANLYGADLRRADLCGANLYGANLCGANLYGADLRRADLCGANLGGANLCGANMDALLCAQLSIVPECGSFVGWKKCAGDSIVQVEIPEDAERSNATGRKCRASHVIVLAIFSPAGTLIDEAVSSHDGTTRYRLGERVTCNKWETDRFVECGGGIHFFLTRAEAEAY